MKFSSLGPSRVSLLSSTSLVSAALLLSLPVTANDVLVDGIAVTDNSPTFIAVSPGAAGVTVVNVTTQSITGPAAYGVRVVGFDGDTTLQSYIWPVDRREHGHVSHVHDG